MWVADMDFVVAPEIQEAVATRARHPAFGYTAVPKSCYDAVIGWLRRRHSWNIEKESMLLCPGVVPSIALAIRAFTMPGDKVIIQSPVYPPFFSVISENGRTTAINELSLKDGRYAMDIAKLRKQIDQRTTMLLLCSPHNPVGRVWEKEELLEIGELCLESDIIIVSDEIHHDLSFPGFRHTPIALLSDSLAENTVTLVAPSKTFNLAGLHTSITIIENKNLRRRFHSVLSSLSLKTVNLFGIAATEASYSKGDEWVDQMIRYVVENYEYLDTFLKERIPEITAIRPDSTYLVWLDCRGLRIDPAEVQRFMVEKARIAMNDGHSFGPGGEGFQRMNIACPRARLTEALQRLESAVVHLRK